jgi:ZIP family zinc transporter
VVDLFSDGLMLGAGSAVESRLGLLLAFGQVLADLPEGFAVVASLKANGLSRRWRIVLSAAFVVPVLLAAALSYFLTHAQGPALQMAALMFTAGLLVVAAVEDMISEAHEAAKDRPATVLALVGGFVLFTFVSAGLAE